MAELAREAAIVPTQKRTEQMIDDLVAFCGEAQFVQDLPKEQQRLVASKMTVERFDKEESVFRRGDVGDKCYIILNGSVGVQLPPAPRTTETPRRRTLRGIAPAFLGQGDVFGERALLDYAPRAATIVCWDTVEVLVITRKDFEDSGGNPVRTVSPTVEFLFRSLKSCARDDFLAQLSLKEAAMEKIPPNYLRDIVTLANGLVEKVVTGHQIVCTQGRVATQVFVVKKGYLHVYRRIRVNTNGVVVKPPDDLTASTPGPEQPPQYADYVICTGKMHPYMNFGAHEALARKKNPVSLVVRPFCAFYTIDRNDLLRRLQRNVVEELFGNSANTLKYPCDDKLWQLSKMRQRWVRYKETLIREHTRYKPADMRTAPTLRDTDKLYFSDMPIGMIMKFGMTPLEWTEDESRAPKLLNVKIKSSRRSSVLAMTSSPWNKARTPPTTPRGQPASTPSGAGLLDRAALETWQPIPTELPGISEMRNPANAKAAVPRCHRQAANPKGVDPYEHKALNAWKALPVDLPLLQECRHDAFNDTNGCRQEK